MPGGHKFTVLAKKWTIVNGKKHTHGRLINGNTGELFWVFDIGDGTPDLKSTWPTNGPAIATGTSFDLHPAQPFKVIQLLYFGFCDRTVPFYQGNLLSFF